MRSISTTMDPLETSVEDPTKDPDPSAETPEHEQLPLGWRIFFLGSGWTLVLIGIAGLVLPGIQGILTILLGLALVGLASETAYSLLERLLSRWPAIWDRMERTREKIIEKLRE